MGRAIPNESLKSALMKDGPADRTNRSPDLTLSFFTGALPDKADMLANCRYHTDGWKYFDSLLTWITGTNGSTELLRMEWDDFAFREHLKATQMRFNLSKRPQTFTPLASGLAGWFLISEQDDSAPYTGGVVRWAVAGTVGIEGSGADFIIPDTNIVTSKAYRGNDITIDFNITGSVS